ncbi:PQQ-like beta-propeller repeat protein [candidate division KSB1 bacterium]|nr:PQQ-like beta-propeller repeat protein [candidate division KSB1 bacterium]
MTIKIQNNLFMFFSIFLFIALLGSTFLPDTGIDGNVKNDWSQYRGPNRDGISSETGLIKNWPDNGPKLIWKTKAGDGYSAISISKGKLFTMWAEGRHEYLFCLDVQSGKKLWRYEVGSSLYNDQGNGPRSCPTVDGELVYAISGKGNLHAVNVENGKKVWGHDLVKEFGGRVARWGYASSPLVEDNKLLVEVAGKEFAYAAFDKITGQVIWTSHSDRPGYSSPIAIDVNGSRQILFFSASGLHGISPVDGKLLWRYKWRTDFDANIAIPIFIAPDKVFISTNYGVGATVLQIKGKDGKFIASPVWRKRVMRNHFNSSVLHGKYIYGFDNSMLKCIDSTNGKEMWKTRGFQKGSLLFADGHFFVLGERGKLALVEANPSRYIEKASVQMLKGKCWTMPTLAGGKLFLRNQSEMICLDVSGS